MRADFEMAYEKYLARFAASITEEQRTTYRRYALGNRERGENAVSILAALIGRDVKGMRCHSRRSGYEHRRDQTLICFGATSKWTLPDVKKANCSPDMRLTHGQGARRSAVPDQVKVMSVLPCENGSETMSPFLYKQKELI